MAWTDIMKVAVGNTVKTQIDSGGAAARLEIYNASPATLLATLPLAYPCGTVGATGTLTIGFDAQQIAVATGTAATAKLITSANVVLEDSIPCSQGVTPVSGRLVLSSLSILADAPIIGVSFTIG